MISNYLYDANHTRLQLVKSVPGEKIFNWLFIPGGPGVDSSYLNGLVKAINLPGNYWLVDFIFNGTNTDYPKTPEAIYQQWPRYLEQVVSQFENPILVGNSFGGYLPFFCPELEKSLTALIILNSVPTTSSDVFAQVIAKHNLPSLTEVKERFIAEPSLENMKAFYMQEVPYLFRKENSAKGIDQIIHKMEFCLDAEHWWYAGGHALYSEIKWVPQNVRTLIMGGSDDFITPFAIFEQDTRFHRHNITMTNIADAGHFPWVEQPDLICETIESFMQSN